MTVTPGYSGRPLWAKLGIKEGFVVCEERCPGEWRDWLDGMPGGVEFQAGLVDGFGFGVVFLRTSAEVVTLCLDAPRKIASDGVLWACYAKKSSPLVTEIDFDLVQQSLLETGLVDIKVCAVSEDFTGLKFMVRKELRKGWRD